MADDAGYALDTCFAAYAHGSVNLAVRPLVVTLALLSCTSDTPSDDSADSSGGTDATTTSASEDESSSGADTADADTTNGGTTDGGSDATGEELYALLCASCHGPDAAGTTLGYQLRHPSREYARWVIRNGRSGTELAPSVMAAYPEALLPDADVDKIFDYLDAFDQPTDGEGLYLDYCRNCHGVDASGGEVEKDIRFEIGDSLEKVREGEGGTNYGSRLGFMPSVPASELSDDDVAAIVSYVQSL